jgi:hypothetical protein
MFIAVACLMLFLRESRYLAGRTADGMIAVGCASSATGIEDRHNVPRRTNTRG